MTLRDFSEKYNGDVQAAMRGLQAEKLGGEVTEIDKTTRKRKWLASQEAEAEASGSGSKPPAEDQDTSRVSKSGELSLWPRPRSLCLAIMVSQPGWQTRRQRERQVPQRALEPRNMHVSKQRTERQAQ